MNEVFYVLEGELEVLAGEQVLKAGRNALINMPKGTVHAVRVNTATARILNLYTPACFERSGGRSGS